MQQQLGVDQPDFGTLFADSVMAITKSFLFPVFCNPALKGDRTGVEPRFARNRYHLRRMYNAIEWVLPALEVVGSRIRAGRFSLSIPWQITLPAGYMSRRSGATSGGVRPEKLRHEDERNNEEVSSGRGSECLGHPLMPPSGWHAKWPAWVNRCAPEYHSYRGIRSDGGGECGQSF